MDNEKIQIVPIVWDERAKHWLSSAIPHPHDRAIIRRQCLSGEAQLWAFSEGVGVSRVEESELVLVAYQGRQYRAMMKAVLALAEQDPQFKTIRSHAITLGIGRWLERLGFDYVQSESSLGDWVYRKVLHGQ